MGKNIAVVLGEMYHQEELQVPVTALRQQDYNVILIGPEKHRTLNMCLRR